MLHFKMQIRQIRLKSFVGSHRSPSWIKGRGGEGRVGEGWREQERVGKGREGKGGGGGGLTHTTLFTKTWQIYTKYRYSGYGLPQQERFIYRMAPSPMTFE